jgi:hypothetical protein
MHDLLSCVTSQPRSAMSLPLPYNRHTC